MEIVPNDAIKFYDYYTRHKVPYAFALATEAEQHLIDLPELMDVPECVLLDLAVAMLPAIAPRRWMGQWAAYRLSKRTPWDALMRDAIQERDTWAVSTLLRHANLLARTENGDTLAHLALESPYILGMLIEEGVPFHRMNKDGDTPLDLAERRGLSKSALQLLANGAKRGAHE